MYFVLAETADRFRVLTYALALMLVFVGLKMVRLNGLYGGTFPIAWSLGIIGALVGGGVALLAVGLGCRCQPPCACAGRVAVRTWR